LKEKRAFPWRETSDPYAIWVSEIMLQQTIAIVVVPYFNKWLEKFPTIESLALAPKDDVVKAWEGLGYYSRARNLHAGAQYILEKHAGIMPSTREELLAIPGIGDYTAGAILNFAFKTKSPAIDGNVTRVIARFLAIDREVTLGPVKKEIYSYVDKILPDHIVSEALIELGALICKKSPDCPKCPLRHECASYLTGVENTIPVLKPRSKAIVLDRTVLIVVHEGHVLLKKEARAKVMQDLYEFPFWERLDAESCFKQLKFTGELLKKLPIEKHTFTKYRVTLHPYLFSAETISDGHLWVPIEDLAKLPFSSGHRRLLVRLFEEQILVKGSLGVIA